MAPRAGVYAAGEGDRGVAAWPLQFSQAWAHEPDKARAMSEAVTRTTIGVAACPVAGIPPPPQAPTGDGASA